jgi:hypothetical protein
MMQGVYLTKIYHERFCKCHSVPQCNNNMIIKNKIKFKKRSQITVLYALFLFPNFSGSVWPTTIL